MDILLDELKIGVEKPFTVLHASDTHLSLADERDDQRKLDLAKQRSQYFPNALDDLTVMSEQAKKYGCPIIYTGDLIDFVSEKNLEVAKDFADKNDLFIAAGNHEFSLYVGEVPLEDEAYRNISLKKVQACFKNDIRFAVREIGGVNFVAIDNSYYQFDKEQLDGLKEVVKQGKPIVLVMHNPIFTEGFAKEIMQTEVCSYLTGAPKELTDTYPEYRKRAQESRDITLKTCEYIKNQPLIKYILCGHVHRNYVDKATDTLTQVTTHISNLRVIKFI